MTNETTLGPGALAAAAIYVSVALARLRLAMGRQADAQAAMDVSDAIDALERAKTYLEAMPKGASV